MLTNENHRKILSILSDTVYGVPQGSNLGPLFLMVFINYLQSFINDGEVILYAKL